MSGGFTKIDPKKLPTMKEIQERRANISTHLADLKKQKIRIDNRTYEVLSTPPSKIKNPKKLAWVLSAFFEEHIDDPYITVNELATTVGYSCYDAMCRDMHRETTPVEYKALLEAAVGKVQSLMEKRVMALSDKTGDTKGYLEILKRQDRTREQRDPELSVGEKGSKTQIAIGIQIAESERVSTILDERINNLMESASRQSKEKKTLPSGYSMEDVRAKFETLVEEKEIKNEKE